MRQLGIDVRAGLDQGECGIRGNDLGGIALHIAARVAAMAVPGEAPFSSTVKDSIAGSGSAFTDRCSHEMDGVSGEWRLFAAGR